MEGVPSGLAVLQQIEIMSSSGNQGKVEEKATAAAAAEKVEKQAMAGGSSSAAAAAMAGDNNKKKKMKKKLMSQREIDCYINYKTVVLPEDMISRVSKERLAHTNLADQGSLPVPMDQMDDYLAGLIRDINRIEAGTMKRREKNLESIL
uniref:Uncharacterized protein n=1 Tax=Leersia perrieri TaxID=77586 RepID=A0A0D9XUN5_9ORYZ